MERFPVHGIVTVVNGERFNGSITFLPTNGRMGPSATTKVADGSYQFDRSNGPAAGPHTVIVKKGIPTPRIPDSVSARQSIPNTKTVWTESVDVADDGRYEHNFTLKN